MRYCDYIPNLARGTDPIECFETQARLISFEVRIEKPSGCAEVPRRTFETRLIAVYLLAGRLGV